MAGVAKQIIGSFEDIGKDIAHETGKVPGEIVGKALESLGTSPQKSQQKQVQAKQGTEQKEQKINKAMARAALEQLAGQPQQKEPTVQERLEKEKQVENEKERKQEAKAVQMAPLEPMSQKTRPGNLYGSVKQKQTSTEKKGFRQD